ncbi:LacI family DNA-binding transcriptional regulator [Symbiobacterium terraclitae]|uniref:LacI family DNA-binding transcriptional regulator n=1 Tax=Symbiobacterium terraclitae TaxID=557451 RepID=UPI0035B51B55
MAVTIRQVARHAGVSVATVSYVLNNDPRVSPETRERVLASIRELDYHPNSWAQGLARRQADIVGLLMPAPRHADPFLLELISGVMDVTAEHHVGLLLLHPGNDADDLPRELLRRRLGGVVVLESQAVDPRVEWLQKRSIPFVLFGRCHQPVDYWIDVDNAAGVRMAIEHLVGLGHRRIGFISAPLKYMFAQFRMAGYREALELHDLPFVPALVHEGDLSEESGYTAAAALLGQPEPPTAIMAASDIMATGALRAIKEQGLRVPDEVALVGFDGTPLSAYTDPPLTTVRQPVYDIGRKVAELLLKVVANPDTESHGELIQPTLLVRGSSAARGPG